MSKTILLNHSNWHFTNENPGIPTAVMGEAITLPHTWNAVDGQDGGNDYYRGTCWYTLALAKPAIPAGGKAILQLDGAAMTAVVYLNGEKLAEHKGGYSTFRVDLTEHLKEENLLAISVDNSDNDTVYPQKADFTFYGGIYRDVTLHIVPAEHFALPANGAPALKVAPIVTDLAAKTAEVTVEAAVVGAQSVTFALEGQSITAPAENGTAKAVFTLDNARLWDGVDDPFLYTVSAKLDNGEETSARFGCRKFEFDPQKGFILNGRSYPLRGARASHRGSRAASANSRGAGAPDASRSMRCVAYASTSSGECVAKTTVMPSSRFTRPSRNKNCFTAFGSSCAVGSSSSSTRGRNASTLARFTICFWPPERSSVFLRTHGSIPKKCATSATRLRISFCGMPTFSSPNASSCHTVSHTICAAGSCITKPIDCADSSAVNVCSPCTPSPLATRPKTRAQPRYAPAGTSSGFNERKSVVLPEPVEPTTTQKAP